MSTLRLSFRRVHGTSAFAQGPVHQAAPPQRTKSLQRRKLSGDARPLAAAVSNATSVQFRANPVRSMELCRLKVCIPSARARGTAEYADDAQEMLLAEELVGEARRDARGRMEPANAPWWRPSSPLIYLVTAVAITVFVPDERRRESAAHRRPGRRLRADPSGQVRVRRLLRRRPSSSPSCRCCCLGRCRTCRLLVAAAGILTLLPDFVQRQWHRDRWVKQLRRLVAVHRPRRRAGAARARADRRRPRRRCTPSRAAAQFGTDFTRGLIRNHCSTGVPIREGLRGLRRNGPCGAIFSQIAFVTTLRLQ